MNQQAGFDEFVPDGVENFVEGHDNGFKIGLEQLQGKVGGSLESGDGNAFALDLFLFHGLGGNYDGAVAFAKAGAAIEQDVFVANGWVGGEADRGDVVGFNERGFVEGLNIGEHVGVLVAGRLELVRGQGVKHECIVGIGGVSELN